MKKTLRLEDALKILLTTGMLSVGAYADIPTGIVGGTTSAPEAYAAFVSSSGVLTPISPLPVGGQILSVALNSASTGLIGQSSGKWDHRRIFHLWRLCGVCFSGSSIA